MFDSCKCFGTELTGPGYLVQKKNEAPKFYSDYKDINLGELHSPNTTLMKVNKTNWESNVLEILKSKDMVFLDPDFPPSEASLGPFELISVDKWKRISEIVKSGSLFGDEIEPRQAASTSCPMEKGLQGVAGCLA